jgi:GTPase SAR1 family protein
MIVIEGPDGAGKTTLKERLFNDIPALDQVERHCDTHGPVTNLRDWVEFQLITPNQIRPTHVYDRHALISEPIYGPIIRGNMVQGFDDEGWYSRMWNYFLTITPSPVFIFCLPPLSDVRINVKAAEQMKGVTKHINPIYWAYHMLYIRMAEASFYRNAYTAIKWDYTVFDNEMEYQSIRRYIEWKIRNLAPSA